MDFNRSCRQDLRSDAVVEMLEAGCKVANVPWDYRGLVLPMMAAGNAIIASKDGVPFGFVFFLKTEMPFTKRTALIEQLLFVLPKHRGSTKNVAGGLLHMLERVAREEGAQDIFAGSSLNNNEEAKRVYNRCGFKTTYAFKKEL